MPMSFQTIAPAPKRLNRSELAVPGNRPELFEKAAKSEADILFLDLEDSVPFHEKEIARRNIISALHEVNWQAKCVSVRINGLDTHYAYRDIVDVLEAAGEHIDLIMLPKAGTAGDIYTLDVLTSQIETACRLKKRIGFEIIIETALGMNNVCEIAAASRRNESLHFGIADYAASIGVRSTTIGGISSDYAILSDTVDEDERSRHLGDVWHYAMSRIVVAARAQGLRPVDGPFGDFSDPEGFRAAVERAAALGFEGKWAIHPSQIEDANEIMSPNQKEIRQAQRVLDAMKEAANKGRGATTLDGRMIDRASICQAEALLAKAKQIRESKANS